MSAYLSCFSHSPLIGYVDPSADILQEVDGMIALSRQRVEAFAPELIVLFSPDHYNGFFYDMMPPFCIGTAAYAIGDFNTLAGPLNVPETLAVDCAKYVLEHDVDLSLSYTMQVDHGFSQPLEQLFGTLNTVPVLPIFINGVAPPLPTFRRARQLGEAIGKFTQTLGKRVLFLASGGLSHQPPVPELATANAHMQDRMKGSGRTLPPDEREARQQRVIDAATRFILDQNTLHPLNPEWDNTFLNAMATGDLASWDKVNNDDLSALAGKSTHEVKAWMAACAAMSVYGNYLTEDCYYRPIPEWIAGFGLLNARRT